MKKLQTPKSNQLFQTRYEQSFSITQRSNLDNSFTQSADSTLIDGENVTAILAGLMIEERRKFLTRKTENHYVSKQLKRMKKSQFLRPVSEKQMKMIPSEIERVLYTEIKCPNPANSELEDAVYGAFFGYVIGDCVGSYMALQTQDLNSYIPAALLMNGGGTFNLASGQGTDETEIMLSAAYGLIDCGKYYSVNTMCLHYLRWLESKPFDLPVLMALSFNDIRKSKGKNKSFDDKNFGAVLLKSSLKNEKQESNLGLVRILPIVVWGLSLNQSDFQKLVADEMSLICPNSLVAETAQVYAKILRIILLERDHEKALYQGSKWVYEHGSQKLLILWDFIENELEIPSKGNMGKLKTSFSYSVIEIRKKQVSFMESLVKILGKGGDCDSNCAIVMAIVGAIVGYQQIPSHFRSKIFNAKMDDSPRRRNKEFLPSKIIDIVPQLMKNRPKKYTKVN